MARATSSRWMRTAFSATSEVAVAYWAHASVTEAGGIVPSGTSAETVSSHIRRRPGRTKQLDGRGKGPVDAVDGMENAFQGVGACQYGARPPVSLPKGDRHGVDRGHPVPGGARALPTV
jgi:hypothetical protein